MTGPGLHLPHCHPHAAARPGPHPCTGAMTAIASRTCRALRAHLPATLLAIGLALPATLLARSSPAAGPGAAVVPASASATGAENARLVARAFQAWGAGAGSVFDLLSEDIRWTIHGSGPVARTYVGKADFIEHGARPLVSRLATPLLPRVHGLWAVDDRVIIRFDADATTRAGRPYRNRFLWIFTLQAGVVVEAEAFLDLVAYQQVIDHTTTD